MDKLIKKVKTIETEGHTLRTHIKPQKYEKLPASLQSLKYNDDKFDEPKVIIARVSMVDKIRY